MKTWIRYKFPFSRKSRARTCIKFSQLFKVVFNHNSHLFKTALLGPFKHPLSFQDYALWPLIKLISFSRLCPVVHSSNSLPFQGGVPEGRGGSEQLIQQNQGIQTKIGWTAYLSRTARIFLTEVWLFPSEICRIRGQLHGLR